MILKGQRVEGVVSRLVFGDGSFEKCSLVEGFVGYWECTLKGIGKMKLLPQASLLPVHEVNHFVLLPMSSLTLLCATKDLKVMGSSDLELETLKP